MRRRAVVHMSIAGVLVGFALAVSACTPFKARDADRNDGGGSSMFRAAVAGVQ